MLLQKDIVSEKNIVSRKKFCLQKNVNNKIGLGGGKLTFGTSIAIFGLFLYIRIRFGTNKSNREAQNLGTESKLQFIYCKL